MSYIPEHTLGADEARLLMHIRATPGFGLILELINGEWADQATDVRKILYNKIISDMEIVPELNYERWLKSKERHDNV